MSSEGHDDAFFKFCLGLLAVVGVLAGTLYMFSFLIPTVIFYVLPFVLVSLSIGFILWFLVQNGEGGFEKVNEYTNEKRYVLRFNFKALALVYPFLVLVTFAIFEAGSVQREVVDKRGNVEGVYFEWPRLNQKYNEMRSNWFRDSMFESLRADAKRPQVYDRSDLGAIVWFALIFGAPSFFFYLARNADQEESRAMTKAAEEKVKEHKDRLKTLIQDQEEILKKRQKPLTEEIERLQERVEQIVSENQVLKAKMEFGTPAQIVKAGQKAKVSEAAGILDGDLL